MKTVDFPRSPLNVFLCRNGARIRFCFPTTGRLLIHRDAADLVIQGDGKFEELMVCSHEIAASTAQLVAASRVSQRGVGNVRRCGDHLVEAPISCMKKFQSLLGCHSSVGIFEYLESETFK